VTTHFGRQLVKQQLAETEQLKLLLVGSSKWYREVTFYNIVLLMSKHSLKETL
jgi:hypothetical protein